MQPLISVIVLTYRHENFIASCLNGILNQEGPFRLEILVGEDASPDSTADIVRSMAEGDQRIRPIIHSQNLGPARNFQKVLSRCRGEYIAYCEGDDVWTAGDKLSRQLEGIRSHDTDMVYSHYGKIDAAGRVLKERVDIGNREVFALVDLIDDHGPSMNSVLIRREALPENFPTPFFEVPNPDVFTLAAALQRRPARLVPGVFSMYRIHEGGIWSGKSQLEKNLIRYSTLSRVFKHFSLRNSQLIRRIHDRLEQAVVLAHRKDAELFRRFWAQLPPMRRIKLEMKWLYARMFG